MKGLEWTHLWRFILLAGLKEGWSVEAYGFGLFGWLCSMRVSQELLFFKSGCFNFLVGILKQLIGSTWVFLYLHL